jgi:hypothetical protein
MSGMSISGGISTAAAALPESRSAAPFALGLLLRVRVVRSRDISVFLFAATPRGARLLNPSRGACPLTYTVLGRAFR